jgi:hypothetical protein
MKKLNRLDWFAIIFLITGLMVLISIPFIKPYVGNIPNDINKTADFESFVNGYIGSFFLLISIVILILTLSSQMKSNQLQQFETKFLDLLKLHRENVSELTLNNKKQRSVFIILRNEFQDLYEIVKEDYKDKEDLKNKEKANITYLIFFFGLGMTSTPIVKNLLSYYDSQLIENILSKVEFYRKRNRYSDLKHLNKFNLDSYYPFNGHQSRLGHYFRHLFQTIKYIDDQNFLTPKDKYFYAKTLRAQLSNHELAIFFYNSISILGKEWSNYGKTDLIKKYQLIKNLPLQNFTYEINPEDFYEQDYEWHKIIPAATS